LLAASAVEMIHQWRLSRCFSSLPENCQQPFVSHFSLTCPLIKPSMRRNLTTANWS